MAAAWEGLCGLISTMTPSNSSARSSSNRPAATMVSNSERLSGRTRSGARSARWSRGDIGIETRTPDGRSFRRRGDYGFASTTSTCEASAQASQLHARWALMR